jgi:hypothetical protein
MCNCRTRYDIKGLLDHEDVRTTTVYDEESEAQRFPTMEQFSGDGVLRGG